MKTYKVSYNLITTMMTLLYNIYYSSDCTINDNIDIDNAINAYLEVIRSSDLFNIFTYTIKDNAYFDICYEIENMLFNNNEDDLDDECNIFNNEFSIAENISNILGKTPIEIIGIIKNRKNDDKYIELSKIDLLYLSCTPDWHELGYAVRKIEIIDKFPEELKNRLMKNIDYDIMISEDINCLLLDCDCDSSYYDIENMSDSIKKDIFKSLVNYNYLFDLSYVEDFIDKFGLDINTINEILKNCINKEKIVQELSELNPANNYPCKYKAVNNEGKIEIIKRTENI